MKQFPNGLTVRELKEYIQDWPDTDELGNESEVWMSNIDGTSSQVKVLWPLNSTDIMFDIE